jgi:hypothetical protein
MNIFTSILALLIGIAGHYTFGMIGQMYLSETIMLVLLPFILVANFRLLRSSPILINFILAGLMMLAGFVLSDLFTANSFHNSIRGFAKVSFLLVDYLFLSLIALRNKNAIWWAALGIGISYIINPVEHIDPALTWKWNYGLAAAMFVICLNRFFSFWIIFGTLFSLSLYSFMMRSRSLGGTMIMTAGLLFYKFQFNRLGLGRFNNLRIVVALCVSFVLLLSIISLSTERLIQGKADSAHGRLRGVIGSLYAIAQSPIIGYGSWNRSTELAEAQQAFFGSSGRYGSKKTIGAHSYLLDSWIEGGILAGFFFMFLGYHAIRNILYAIGKREYDYLSVITIFFMILTLWNIIQSPFGGGHRIMIALTIAIIVYNASLQTKESRPSPSPIYSPVAQN